MPQQISSLSTEYIRTTVKAPTGVSLIALPVHFAFMAAGVEPGAGDWKVGSWDAGNVAKILVGPGAGGNALADGSYKVWVKVTGNPEIPIVQFDSLKVK